MTRPDDQQGSKRGRDRSGTRPLQDGGRFTRRTFNEPGFVWDPDDGLDIPRFEAEAFAVLEKAGVHRRQVFVGDGGCHALELVQLAGYRRDSAPDIAARIIEEVHFLHGAAPSVGQLGNFPPVVQDLVLEAFYRLGRLVLLNRVYAQTTAQAQDAAKKNQHLHFETDTGRANKQRLVVSAVKAAGPGGSSDDGWLRLMGDLASLGGEPVETGAKDERRLDWLSADGEPLTFTFRDFKARASRARAALGYRAPRGRPTKK